MAYYVVSEIDIYECHRVSDPAAADDLARRTAEESPGKTVYSAFTTQACS